MRASVFSAPGTFTVNGMPVPGVDMPALASAVCESVLIFRVLGN